ncbi:MAG: hypothetical protein AB4290_12535 [Spirulina sp.]
MLWCFMLLCRFSQTRRGEITGINFKEETGIPAFWSRVRYSIDVGAVGGKQICGMSEV